ncbi:MAG: hypothetical protein N2167_08230 [Flavobacteriales bacterium]|nr:hypothetical protein [Flavobacteriales bacterium]
MHPYVKNSLALVAGFIGGSIINMAIIQISGYIIPPPDGADTTTMEGLKQAIHLFSPIHFLMPFLAHAVGTLVGALITGLIATGNTQLLSWLIGLLFMAGGITSYVMLLAPTWFGIIDIGLAYLPMAWIGWKLSKRLKEKKQNNKF